MGGYQSPWGFTPSTAASSAFQQPPRAFPAPPNFHDYLNNTFGEEGVKQLPDNAYEAMQEKFYNEHVLPWGASTGQALEPLQEQFMKQTARDKVEFPRTELMAKQALASITAPFKMFGGALAQPAINYEKAADEAALEYAKQGGNPGLYRWLGAMTGEAPYWMAGAGIAGAAAGGIAAKTGMEAASELVLKKSLTTAAIGLVQGAYDAAKAPEGSRWQEGMQGAAMGAATAGAIEFRGPLWRYLTGFGLGDDEAKAVQAVVLNKALPAQEDLAAQAVMNTPQLEGKVSNWVTQQIAGAKAAGVPKDAISEVPNGRFSINLKTVDGQLYNLGGDAGAKLEDFSKIIDRIYGHLNQGASIESIKGDPEAMTKFWNALEKLNSSTFNIDVPERGANSDVNSPTQLMANDTIGPQKPRLALPPATTPEPELSFSERLRRLELATREEPVSSRRLLLEDVPPLERPASLSRPDQGLRNRVEDLYNAGLGIQDIADKMDVNYNTVLSWLGEAEPGPLEMTGPLSSGLRRMALEGEPPMTPEEISKGAEPFTPEALYSRGLVRGSIDVPLNKEGMDRAELVGRGLQGQFDRLTSADLTRDLQTVAPFKKHNPQAEVDAPNPAWRSWARGEFEGGDPDVASKFSDALVKDPDNWDIRHPGMSPQSTQPGESFNDFINRVIPAFEKLRDEWKADKEIRGDAGPKYGIFTHFNPIRLVESYVKEGGPKNLGIDFEHYLGPEPEAGLMMHYNPETNVMKPFDPLKYDGEGLDPGMLFTRHEDTDMNPAPPAISKETSLYRRVMAAPGAGSSVEPGDTGATLYSKPGEKPTVAFNPQETIDKGIIHHEMIHAHINNLDLHDWFRQDDIRGGGRASPDSFVKDVYNGLLKRMGYSPRGSAEEAFAYASQGFRDRNDRLLDALAAADTDRETLAKWYTNKANALMDQTAELPDSLHKRTLERRINYTISQSSGMLNDIRRTFAQTHDIDYDPDTQLWSTESLQTGERNYFRDRNEALAHLEDIGVQEPLNSPELVDTSKLPEFPHFARRLEPPNNGKPPIHTNPPGPLFDQEKKASIAIASFSGWVRPFYRWVDTIGTRLGRPDLPSAFYKIRDDLVEFANQMRPYVETMTDTIGNKPKYEADGWARQQDFMKWIAAKTQDGRDMAIREAGFTAEELSDLDQFEQHFKNLPGFMDWIQDTAPALKAGNMTVADRFPPSDTSMEARLVRRGQLDPNDGDLRRVAATFLQGRMFNDYVKSSVDAAESLVNEKLDDNYTFGLLRPLLNRQVQFYRGVPDYTQQMVMDGISKFTQLYNKGVDKLNGKVMPDWFQLNHIEEGPRDVLQQFILFNYAGSLALRPMVPIRDSLQLFLTSYPILGEEYIWKGMRRTWNGAEDSLGRDAYEAGQQSGWLIERRDLPEMLGGGETKEEGLGAKVEGKVESWVKNALSVISYAHNSNRLVAGWGHTLKIMDALEDFAADGDPDKFIRKSDFWFLGDARRDALVKEAGMLTRNPDQWESFAQRAARDLVDATQWNFSKGAAPGIYKYQLGRLFGQYGTYPANYIEYGRNLVGSLAGPYRKEAAIALTRLGITHMSVLAAMSAMGIDASHWLFTQPMTYGGGPIFEAITNIPQSMDFQSYKGAEARKKLIEPLFPGMLPGYDELHGLFNSISNKDDDAWTNVLRFGGFTPMTPGAAEQGWHKFVP